MPSAYSMMFHINSLLDDYGDEKDYTLGHRRDLVKPNFSKFGFGITGNVGAINLSGYQNWSYVCTGWPAVNGVTFLEHLLDRRFKWTASFDESRYKVTDSTTTEVKCLNTGEIWSFTEEENKDGRIYENVVLGGNVINSASNKILLYEHDIEPMAGYVYQVTINGLENIKTGKTDSYTYRTVFANADAQMDPDSFNSVKIEVPEDLKQVKSNIYNAEVGKTIKLNAKVDNTTVVDLKLTWTSSNNDAISVTQDGRITINKLANEDVTIRVSYDGDNSIMDQIIIRTEKKEELLKGDVNDDGRVTLYDALQILKQAILKGNLSEEQLYIMDYNDDEKVTLFDALKFLQKAILG